jgi:hypothetical protein
MNNITEESRGTSTLPSDFSPLIIRDNNIDDDYVTTETTNPEHILK